MKHQEWKHFFNLHLRSSSVVVKVMPLFEQGSRSSINVLIILNT